MAAMLVAGGAALAAEPAAGKTAPAPGTSVKLVLETLADHDELVPELVSDTL